MKERQFEAEEYWKNYMIGWFGKDLIEKWENSVEIIEIISGGIKVHLEIYVQNQEGPTIVFSHGIAGYARVLLPFILPLYEMGYNFVVPDLQGYGYNEGRKGDFTWNSHVENLVDSVKEAKSRFRGKVFLGGASMGGPLAYSASCRIPELVDGLVAWCLWDFSDRDFIKNETATGPLTYLLLPLFKLVGHIFGAIRIKTYHLVSYETLTGSTVFNDLIKKDPQAGTHVTLRGALSLITDSAPDIPHETYEKPVLIMQPERDRMTPKEYIEKTYEALGSKIKRYYEVKECEHFPTEMRFYEIWAHEVDSFLKSLSKIN